MKLFLFSVALLCVGVIADKGNLTIYPQKKHLLVNEGASVKLECIFEDVATAIDVKLKWSENDGRGFSSINADDKVTINKTVVISNFSKRKARVYTCKTENRAREISGEITLYLVQEQKLEANYTYKDKTAMLGCNITLTDPGMEVQWVEWLQNSTRLTDLEGYNSLYKLSSDNSTLTIHDKNGIDRKLANLYIARFYIKDTDDTYDCHVHYRASAFVEKFDKSKNLIEGDNLELQCKIKGHPSPEVTWYKDGAEVTVNPMDFNARIKKFTFRGVAGAGLQIDDMEFDDEGKYMCKAYSSYFNDSHNQTITVRVKGRLAALWPFLGIVAEVVVLCIIIFIYERRRNKSAQQEEAVAQPGHSDTVKKEGVRHRSHKK